MRHPKSRCKSDRPQDQLDNAGEPLAFDALTSVNYAEMPELQPFTARDGATLYYRHYKSNLPTNKIVILLHGSGWHSMQFYPLALYLSKQGVATVITPDLRGHGFNRSSKCGKIYTRIWIGELAFRLFNFLAVFGITKPSHPRSADCTPLDVTHQTHRSDTAGIWPEHGNKFLSWIVLTNPFFAAFSSRMW